MQQLGKRKSSVGGRHGASEQRLTNIPHRTYLWVYLVFDYLMSQDFKKTKKGIESPITSLPESVNQAYEKILSKSRDSAVVRKALCVILVAQRPLTLAEMNCAVNADLSLRSYEDLDLEEEKDFKARLRDWCGLFVSVYHDKVYFLHQTAREFLIQPESAFPAASSVLRWHRSITLRKAHEVLAEACVAYISLLESDSSILEPRQKDSTRYKFLEYAAKQWGDHVRLARISVESPLIPVLIEISEPLSNHLQRWATVYNPLNVPDPSFFPSTLIIASRFGIEALVEILLAQQDIDLEVKGGQRDETALWSASLYGYESIVKRLIQAGANVDVYDKDGRSALSRAAYEGHEGIARLHLDHGAKLETRNEIGQTPLALAAEGRHEDVSRFLLDRGAQIEAQDQDGQTPLALAAMMGSEAVVKLLIERGADIDKRDLKKRTPLSLAAARGNEGVVRELLANGANTAIPDYNNETPLALATKNKREGVVKLLQMHDRTV